jgi:hypothetical protein
LQAGDSHLGEFTACYLSLYSLGECALFDSQLAHGLAFVGLNVSLFVLRPLLLLAALMRDYCVYVF